MQLLLRVAALSTEFTDFWNRLPTVEAKLRICPGSGRGCCARNRRGSGFSTGRPSLLQGIHHCLTHRHARAESSAYSRSAATFVRRRNRNCLCNFVLRIPPHIADHIHADSLIKDLLKLVRERQILDHETVERQPEFGESRFELPDN